ncbi:tautomerase family protein [Vibrio salinus]|uniref:tautomerase family protein n=1 Tax=Vibrio salinus TaxID=2899784 RepID=UPI001E4A0580|nr:tautomerase family protein [Vibrio salinus]MCE0495057.1 tautomerase family protein [Vibrio salinus]
MPMTRISIGNELFETHQHQISHILQQCLEAHFDVPDGDCFQIFDIHTPQQKVFNPYYPNLAKSRSESGILFHIFAGKPRDHKQKRALYKALCEQLQENTSINKEDIMIILQFNGAEDWSFSSGQSWKDEMETTK